MQPGPSQTPGLQNYEQNTVVVLSHCVLGNVLHGNSNRNVPAEKCLPDKNVWIHSAANPDSLIPSGPLG